MSRLPQCVPHQVDCIQRQARTISTWCRSIASVLQVSPPGDADTIAYRKVDVIAADLPPPATCICGPPQLSRSMIEPPRPVARPMDRKLMWDFAILSQPMWDHHSKELAGRARAVVAGDAAWRMKMVDNVMTVTQDQPKPRAAGRLCNFKTGQADLLQDHKDWIDKTVGPIITSLQGTWVDLIGYASKLGNAKSNKALSGRRVDAVRDYIATWKKGINFQKEVALGEEQSMGDESNNDGYFRAVEVYVYGFAPPPLRPRVEKKNPTLKKFFIRPVSAVSIGIGPAGVDAVAFDIGEPAKRKWRRFIYTGASMNISLKKFPDFPRFRPSAPAARDRRSPSRRANPARSRISRARRRSSTDRDLPSGRSRSAAKWACRSRARSSSPSARS